MRRFLQGLGFGILLAALVMGISYRNNGAVAGEDVVEKARELGMVFPAGTEEPDDGLTADDLDSSGDSTDGSGEEVASADSTSEGDEQGAGLGGDNTSDTTDKKEDSSEDSSQATDAPKATKKPSKTKEPSSTPSSTQDPSTLKTGQKVTFTVESGLLASSVAREMKKAGIIADDTAFNHYLIEQGLGKKVIAGTYDLTVGASYAELARIITRSN